MIYETILQEAELNPDQINGVILAGGSTRIPLIRRSIEEVFGQKLISAVNVGEVVARGAALYAAYCCRDQLNLTSYQSAAIDRMGRLPVTNKSYGTDVVVRDERTGKEKRQNSIIIRKGTDASSGD